MVLCPTLSLPLSRVVSHKCLDFFLNSLSGGDDDAHGNQTKLEAALAAANATWEVTRYAGVGHGYTDWSSEMFSFAADARSWDSMLGVVFERLAVPQFVASASDVPSSVPTPAAPTAATAVPPPTSATAMPTPTSGFSEMPSMVPTVESGGNPSAPTTNRDVNTTESTSGGSLASLSVFVALAAPCILTLAMGN
jgi:Dienelactone hydrolase family